MLSDKECKNPNCGHEKCKNCSCSEPCTAETCDCVNATEK